MWNIVEDEGPFYNISFTLRLNWNILKYCVGKKMLTFNGGIYGIGEKPSSLWCYGVKTLACNHFKKVFIFITNMILG